MKDSLEFVAHRCSPRGGRMFLASVYGCIACGDSVFDARSAARTGDFCFGKSHQNHFAPSSHPTPSAKRLGWGALRSSVGKGVFRQYVLYCEKRAPPGRAPQGKALRAVSSPTCGARCDSRGGEHLNQENPSKSNTQNPEDSDVGVLTYPPFRRAEHRRPRRSRPDRGAPGRRALAAGQESCRPTPVSAEKHRGSRAGGACFLLGTFLCTSKEKYPARGAGTAII